MSKLVIILSDGVRPFVESQAAAGHYSSPSDFVEELVRREEKRRAKERLDTLLLEGLDSGEPTELNHEEWERMRSEAKQLLAARKKS